MKNLLGVENFDTPIYKLLRDNGFTFHKKTKYIDINITAKDNNGNLIETPSIKYQFKTDDKKKTIKKN
jgi:hypothetical protein